MHLDVAELKKVIEVVESEYSVANKELNTILADLNQKYPNGEIDLIDGKIIYQK